MEYAISTKNVTKKYKNFIALDSINIHIKKRTIYGLIGKNGAGKTTLLKILTGLIRETSGEIDLHGNDLCCIGSLIEEPGLCLDMTAFENLKLKSIALGIVDEIKIYEILNIVGLSKYKKLKAKKYSLGMKQRLGIALALVGDPEIIILDEPINGLDPQGIAEIRNLILNLKKNYNKTIIISSHILEELFKIGDTYAIINKGKLIIEASKEALMKKIECNIEIETDSVDKAINLLKMEDYTKYENKIVIKTPILKVRELNKILVENDIPIDGIKYVEESYEGLFLELIGEK